MPRISIGTLANIMMTAALVLGAPPKIGDRAPELAIDTMLKGPVDNDLSWKALKGQALVLEFWATWCGPCIGAIPHFNELAEAVRELCTERRSSMTTLMGDGRWLGRPSNPGLQSR